MSELIFLGLLALIIIGPKELPELARTLGRFMNELKRSTSVLGDELKQQARLDFDAPKKPKQSKAAAAEPQQMELTEQSSSDNNEHKPS